ncbi:hypothetical protein [Pedobacter jejuensis]|uniref:Uncharacterized protein n=1 Tax=Pedobacter jejuensis TaxID=1268550 RepID=A0A3N0BST6_9SPHI|nr:hypothetical protein [Pedobacter jejuensis]RNL52141.1 hypothetical protein D7004_11180 [Pedobacter jejuensis]
MEKELLAIQYFQLKEKALVQREYIDYTMADHLKLLKEDKTETGKEHLEQYKKEIDAAEDEFLQTILNVKPIFEKLFLYLQSDAATKKSPYTFNFMDMQIEMYIDDNKNIHYKKS